LFAKREITFAKEDSMRLKFYGTRGSIPICDAGFQQFGGNTTCLQITFTDINRIAIIDSGTGLRNLGSDLRAIGHKQDRIVIAFTHFHWDHIQGFPFFAQAYDPGQKITLLTLGRGQTIANLREIFEVQMQAEYFPVQLDHMGATFEFLQIADASQHFTGINNVETVVSAQRHNHPGGAYSFRIERNGKVLVVCTDVDTASRLIRDWWSWRRVRTCWSMTRNTRPRNCRNGADDLRFAPDGAWRGLVAQRQTCWLHSRICR
jgi:phosphoribosyl 1,2-cyclic phosphodiesterase